MAALLYEPFYDFDHLVDSFFHDATNNLRPRRVWNTVNTLNEGAIRDLKPRMDLHENSEANSVTATFELPGFRKEDVQIDLQNGRLTIAAENKIESDREEGGYAVRERRYGKFSRTLQLPQGIKSEEVKALMEDGVLTVTFPKVAPEMGSKKITIA